LDATGAKGRQSFKVVQTAKASDVIDRWAGHKRLVGVALIAMLAVGALVAIGLSIGWPGWNSGYTVSIEPGIQPQTSAARAAGVARRYLDEQTPELAAPELHVDPRIMRLSAARAADVRQVEPGVPEQAAAGQPDRIVWVVSATGDFLNLHRLEWSEAGMAYPSGNIVIDDATAAVLGVYPHDLPGVPIPTLRR
jgi:predicted NBD/HSP70 family sugar kinase